MFVFFRGKLLPAKKKSLVFQYFLEFKLHCTLKKRRKSIWIVFLETNSLSKELDRKRKLFFKYRFLSSVSSSSGIIGQPNPLFGSPHFAGTEKQKEEEKKKRESFFLMIECLGPETRSR